MKVVFDTNILVSALGWGGRPRRCVDLARRRVVEGYICLEILDELADVLQRKLGLAPELVIEVVEELLGFLRVVRISGRLQVIAQDPDDDKVLECAVVAGARYVVSGDSHLLALGAYEGITVQTPAAFLDGMSGLPESR